MSVSDTRQHLMSPQVTSYGLGYSIAVIFNALLIILHESSPAVHDFMALMTGHHWATQGVLDLLIFVLFGMLLSCGGIQWEGKKLSVVMVGSTVLSGLMIIGFFAIVG